MNAFEWLETFGGKVALMMPRLERSFEYELRDLLHIGRKDLTHSKHVLSWRNLAGRGVTLYLLQACYPNGIRGLGLQRAWVHHSLVRHDLEALNYLQLALMANSPQDLERLRGRTQFDQTWHGPLHGGSLIPRTGIATSRGLSTPVRVLDLRNIFRFQRAAQQFGNGWELALTGGGRRRGS